MDYILSFLEGIITFISPCLLPMLPIYISYFAGQGRTNAMLDNNLNNISSEMSMASGISKKICTTNKQASPKHKTIINALGFVLGFTSVFVALGAFAGTIGGFLREYDTAVNIVSGTVVVIFGLNFIGIVKIPFLNTNKRIALKTVDMGFFPAVLFGIVFSVGWTPCVGAFLGSALMLAGQFGNSAKGVLMLLSFSLGLGIPFVASAVLIDRLKTAFDFIKRNYRIINIISGGLLIIVGIMMMTGMMGYFLSLLTF